MKIKYQFATETIEIEVDDEWGDIIVDLNRQEYNNDHKETRRHYSLDAYDWEDETFAVDDPGFSRLFEEPSLAERLSGAIAQLKPRQKELIRSIYFEGKTARQYAKELGISEQAVGQQLKTVIKKLKKIM